MEIRNYYDLTKDEQIEMLKQIKIKYIVDTTSGNIIKNTNCSGILLSSALTVLLSIITLNNK